MKPLSLLLLLATIGCKQEVMAQVKDVPMPITAQSPGSQCSPDYGLDGHFQGWMCEGPKAAQSYEFTKFPGYISVATPDSTVVKLSDEEYSNLQKLRQAVVDEEKRLAVKYGADLNYWCGEAGDICKWPDGWRPDTYTFHQQFLLIDKAEPTIAFPAHWGDEGMNKPKRWGSGISGRLVMPKSTPPPDNALILNCFPDGSVLKGSR